MCVSLTGWTTVGFTTCLHMCIWSWLRCLHLGPKSQLHEEDSEINGCISCLLRDNIGLLIFLTRSGIREFDVCAVQMLCWSFLWCIWAYAKTSALQLVRKAGSTQVSLQKKLSYLHPQWGILKIWRSDIGYQFCMYIPEPPSGMSARQFLVCLYFKYKDGGNDIFLSV